MTVVSTSVDGCPIDIFEVRTIVRVYHTSVISNYEHIHYLRECLKLLNLNFELVCEMNDGAGS